MISCCEMCCWPLDKQRCTDGMRLATNGLPPGRSVPSRPLPDEALQGTPTAKSFAFVIGLLSACSLILVTILGSHNHTPLFIPISTNHLFCNRVSHAHKAIRTPLYNMLDIRLLKAVVPQLTCLRFAHLANSCTAAWGQAPLRWASTSSDQQKGVIVIPMPKLSPSMNEGTVSKWVKVGTSKSTVADDTSCMGKQSKKLHIDVEGYQNFSRLMSPGPRR